MKKTVDWFGVDNLISAIKLRSKYDKYYRQQLEIIDKNKMAEFLMFCEELADYSHVDELGGIPPKKSDRQYTRRYTIDKKLEDIIHKADTSIGCGIQINMNQTTRISPWEKWNDGFIEGFARMDADEGGVEWFIWQYIKMEFLETILTEFKNDLIVL